MMEQIDLATLRSWLEQGTGPRVSLYLPSGLGTVALQEARIRYKNLLSRAEEALVRNGLRFADARALLEPARGVLNRDPFAPAHSEGLAVLCAAGEFHTLGLPYRCPELALAGRNYHILPLIPLTGGPDRYYVLAFAQNHARFWLGDRQELRDRTPAGMPVSLADSQRFDDSEKSLQFHTRASSQQAGRFAVFHGQGGAADARDEGLLRFAQKVDNAIGPLLRQNGGPLVLAAVESLAAIYREANTYNKLVEPPLLGSPESLKPHELHRRAWTLAEPIFRQNRERLLTRFNEALVKNRGSQDLEVLVPAAHEGRLGALIAAADRQVWGKFDPQSGQVERGAQYAPGQEDLVNLAAIGTLRHGGSVVAVPAEQVPNHSVAAGIFRF